MSESARPATLPEILEAVASRGLTTPAGHDDHADDYEVIARCETSALIRGEWWHEYSRSHPKRQVRAAYLGGADGDGTWAVRVPATDGRTYYGDPAMPTISSAWAFCWGSRQIDEIAYLPWRRQGDLLFSSRLLCRTADPAEQAAELNRQIAEQADPDGWNRHVRREPLRHSVRVHKGGGLIARHEGGHHAVRLPLTISAAEAHAEIQSLEYSGRSRLPRATRGRYGLTWRATLARQDAGSGGRGCGD